MGKTWDSIPVERETVSDLDSNVIAKFREIAVKKKRLNPDIAKVFFLLVWLKLGGEGLRR